MLYTGVLLVLCVYTVTMYVCVICVHYHAKCLHFRAFIIPQHLAKVHIKGEKPAARMYHTALCIEHPHTAHHPLLMVEGGKGRRTALSDVWVLDVTDGVWSQV